MRCESEFLPVNPGARSQYTKSSRQTRIVISITKVRFLQLLRTRGVTVAKMTEPRGCCYCTCIRNNFLRRCWRFFMKYWKMHLLTNFDQFSWTSERCSSSVQRIRESEPGIKGRLWRRAVPGSNIDRLAIPQLTMKQSHARWQPLWKKPYVLVPLIARDRKKLLNSHFFAALFTYKLFRICEHLLCLFLKTIFKRSCWNV